MKTLDEVIELCEKALWCAYLPQDDTTTTAGLALYYLREYKDKAHRLNIDIAEHARSFEQLGVEIARYQEAVRNCEEAENRFRKMEDELNDIRREHIEQMKNPPLTWDELKTLEGKPVWIQEGDHGYWIIINNFSITSYGYHWLNSAEECLEKEYMGISWQAYRKEKE